jgi:cell division septal protein FtsQ
MYGLLGVLVVYALYRGSSVVADAHVLQVDRIVGRGNERLAEGDVLAVLSGLRGESLLWTDLDRWRRRLLASPWVRDAVLRRSLPSTVESWSGSVSPSGLAASTARCTRRRSGVIVDGMRAADEAHRTHAVPVIIDGLTRSADQDGAGTDEARAGLAARVITALRAKPAVARKLSQVDVTDVRNAAVILNGDSAVIQLGDDQFLPRLQGYLELAPSLRARVPDIDYVDVRGRTKIVVTEATNPQVRQVVKTPNERRRNVNPGPEAAWRAKSGIW